MDNNLGEDFFKIPPVSQKTIINLYYSIGNLRDFLNANFDSVDKRPWQAHMAFLKMATLVFPVSMCLGQGLYAEQFCL